MSKGQGKDRAGGEREAAARGAEGETHERPLSLSGTSEVLGKHGGAAITQPQHHKPPKSAKAAAQRPAKSAGKGRPTPKQTSGPSQSRPGQAKPAQKVQKKAQKKGPAAKKGRSHPGRPDGPLARRRRLRIRLLVALWLVVNVAAGAIWQDWKVSLAVFVLSILITPLLGALLLRRR